MGLAEYPKPNCSCHTCDMERSHMTQIVDVMVTLIKWLAETAYPLKHRASGIIAAARIMDAKADPFISKRDAYALLDAFVDCENRYPYLLCRELWSKFGLAETAFAQMYLAGCTPHTAARISADEALTSVIENGWCYDASYLGSTLVLPNGTFYDVAVYDRVYNLPVSWAEKDRIVVAAVNAASADEVPEEVRDLYEKSAPWRV